MNRRLSMLMVNVAHRCDVNSDVVASNRRYPAAVKARRLVAFLARWELELSTVEIAEHLTLPVQSVRRLIREAEHQGRSDAEFAELLFDLRRAA